MAYSRPGAVAQYVTTNGRSRLVRVINGRPSERPLIALPVIRCAAARKTTAGYCVLDRMRPPADFG